MNQHITYLTKVIFLTTCLALGCTSSGTLGCGSDDGAAATVDSELLGIYLVDNTQSSTGGCDQLMDIDGATRLVLYSTVSDADPTKARLAGQFCGSVEDCRQRAKGPSTVLNYAFFDGSDAQGWQGWGIASQGSVGDQCLFEVQSHLLTSPSDRAIRIDTKTVETVFPPKVPEGSSEATCSTLDAIGSVTDDSPCKSLFLVEATFETAL